MIARLQGYADGGFDAFEFMFRQALRRVRVTDRIVINNALETIKTERRKSRQYLARLRRKWLANIDPATGLPSTVEADARNEIAAAFARIQF